MAKILNFQEFVKTLSEKVDNDQRIRNHELAGLKDSEYLDRYAIEISFDLEDEPQYLFEHEVYKKFKKTTNRYVKHPEHPGIPVKAHYHVYPPNSKAEIYAVNMDGTAHHRDNKGYTVSNKEADELRGLGVTIPLSNIIESIQMQDGGKRKLLLESQQKDTCYSIFIMIG